MSKIFKKQSEVAFTKKETLNCYITGKRNLKFKITFGNGG